MVALPIYLDNNATTRTDPRVLEEMLPFFTEVYGNPASRNHEFGSQADQAVEHAREQVARLIGAKPREIIFTSGATESNNLAIKGAASYYRNKGNHLITCTTEHKAVIDPCKRLERQGFEVTWLSPDPTGRIAPEQIEASLKPETTLVSIMFANNEIGTIQPIQQIGEICHRNGVLLHCDATQAVGKIPVNVEELQVDLLSLSAHKFYGPKGIGALFVRSKGPRVRLDPLFDGGGHERGIRAGTLPAPNIIGLGAACAIAEQEMASEAPRLQRLRDRLQQSITQQLDGVHFNGHPVHRLPGTLNLSFDHVDGEALMIAMGNVACSSGSACTSASMEPSYVLRAIGRSDEQAHASLRFGIGRFNTEEEIDFAAETVVRAVKELRQMSPVYEWTR